jgi:hypothetical protein
MATTATAVSVFAFNLPGNLHGALAIEDNCVVLPGGLPLYPDFFRRLVREGTHLETNNVAEVARLIGVSVREPGIRSRGEAVQAAPAEFRRDVFSIGYLRYLHEHFDGPLSWHSGDNVFFTANGAVFSLDFFRRWRTSRPQAVVESRSLSWLLERLGGEIGEPGFVARR